MLIKDQGLMYFEKTEISITLSSPQFNNVQAYYTATWENNALKHEKTFEVILVKFRIKI